MSTHTNGTANSGKASEILDTEVVPAKAKRRSFSAKQKLQILVELDNLPKGETGAYLRRKGLYSSSISEWRRQRDEGTLSLSGGAPQRGPAPRSAESKEVQRLELENAKLVKKLEQAGMIISAQKKLCEIYSQFSDQAKGDIK